MAKKENSENSLKGVKKIESAPAVKQNVGPINEAALFKHISEIIETRKVMAGAFANREVTLMRWEVGHYIRSALLNNDRAEYGKQIVTTLSSQLVERYGKTFDVHNLRRMIRFAERFSDVEIVTTLSSQLSWSHFLELLPLKNEEAMLYYAKDAAARNLGVIDMRKQISRKAYERREIANTQLSKDSAVPFNVFKDPYLLNTLGLRDNFLEADLERAIILGLESFILEFGSGFSFVERQKRMTVGDDDYVLDLLFYHRDLRRLVAVELKIGKFIPQYKGQMEFYLNWLDRHERRRGEESPIGIILCATANRNAIEYLKMDKAGIAVAEYWTELPPKTVFEQKIKEIIQEARERLERRKSLPKDPGRQIDYFLEGKDDEET